MAEYIQVNEEGDLTFDEWRALRVLCDKARATCPEKNCNGCLLYAADSEGYKICAYSLIEENI